MEWPRTANPTRSTARKRQMLAINPATQKAYMAFDECWYCMPCEKDCPTGAVKVDIPYLLR